jgi:SAM-dependent methyltransferase
MDPAKDWKRFGAEDAFYGVISSETNRAKKIDRIAIDKFYDSGRQYAEIILGVLKKHFDFECRGRALDFGCGVGRLTFALAERFDQVVGLDIAEGMLSEARKQADLRGLKNVEFKLSSGADTIPTNSFDFVNTFIVLQHMTRQQGETAIRAMLDGLADEGVGAIHLTYGNAAGSLQHGIREAVKRNAVLRQLANIAVGRRWNAPAMLMTAYRLDRVFNILGEFGIEKVFVHRIDDWGEFGTFLFFRRGKGALADLSNPVR